MSPGLAASPRLDAHPFCANAMAGSACMLSWVAMTTQSARRGSAATCSHDENRYSRPTLCLPSDAGVSRVARVSGPPRILPVLDEPLVVLARLRDADDAEQLRVFVRILRVRLRSGAVSASARIGRARERAIARARPPCHGIRHR